MPVATVRASEPLYALRDENNRLVQQLTELELEYSRLKAQHQALESTINTRMKEADESIAAANDAQKQAREQSTEAQLRLEQLELDLGRQRRVAAEAAAQASREAVEVEAKHSAEVEVLRRECRARDRDMLALRRDLARTESRLREVESGSSKAAASLMEGEVARADAAEARVQELLEKCQKLEEVQADLHEEVSTLKAALSSCRTSHLCRVRQDREAGIGTEPPLGPPLLASTVAAAGAVIPPAGNEALAAFACSADVPADGAGSGYAASLFCAATAGQEGAARGGTSQSMLQDLDEAGAQHQVSAIAALQNQVDSLRKENLKIRMERCIAGQPLRDSQSQRAGTAMSGASTNGPADSHVRWEVSSAGSTCATSHPEKALSAGGVQFGSHPQAENDDPVQIVRDLRRKLFGERAPLEQLRPLSSQQERAASLLRADTMPQQLPTHFETERSSRGGLAHLSRTAL
eukprot:CAMPEP_0178434344 /NCGR_PEP_ID=MMETSP0689_2-20121128/33376_1 /TAXON_ID=160604 /ORGANISM="Amphidinium massartii, Strain CS-259" /LENGTH=464 /DNA_ID=CAMNT_0020056407 /DNA_START=21 /DNA_END=1416 /DNA_ORIENTATION=-